ncbi:MAG: hypothetical protein IKZ82_06600 [Clostridia bacterium]|nr:hypothetical protein [Clostridia bacterium]
MKKLLSALLIMLLILPCVTAFASSADALPFDLNAPANVAAQWLGGNDSPTTVSFSYSLDNSITDFFKRLEQAHLDGNPETLFEGRSYDEIFLVAQIDWALDDVNDPVSGWHANEFWEPKGEYGFGYDENWNWRVSEWDGVEIGLNNGTETVQDVWLLRAVPDDTRWNGDPDAGTPGVKDQLNEDQYEYHDDSVHIDFTEHTAYFRARLVATTRSNGDEVVDKHYYSEWSETCAVGKDAEKIEPIKPGEIAAPVITNLRMTDETFNDNPVVAYTLTVPDELAKQVTSASAMGGNLCIETYARVKGDAEWIEMQNTDWTVSAGERKCSLIHLVNEQRPHIEKDTEIELRCRYRCDQPDTESIFSDWSNVIAFGTDNVDIGGNPAVTGAPTADTNAPETKPEEKKECSICHFCPQPLGLCIFIWLAIILIIIIIIVILLKKKKNGNK